VIGINENQMVLCRANTEHGAKPPNQDLPTSSLPFWTCEGERYHAKSVEAGGSVRESTAFEACQQISSEKQNKNQQKC
jgi:hypothetical protein